MNSSNYQHPNRWHSTYVTIVCGIRRLSALLLNRVIWFAFFISIPCFALDPGKALHQYRHDQWSTPEGLPQVTVLSIAQDRDHFIWLGTQVGLARFDGRAFRVFNAENSPGLRNNYINSLVALDDGTLWVGTRGGISRYAHHEMEQVLPLANTGVVHQLRYINGQILAATDNGLVQFHPDKPESPTWLFQRAVQVDDTVVKGEDLA